MRQQLMLKVFKMPAFLKVESLGAQCWLQLQVIVLVADLGLTYRLVEEYPILRAQTTLTDKPL